MASFVCFCFQFWLAVVCFPLFAIYVGWHRLRFSRASHRLHVFLSIILFGTWTFSCVRQLCRLASVAVFQLLARFAPTARFCFESWLIYYVIVIRGTQRENFSVGVGTPFLPYKCPFVVNAKKNVSVRIR